MKNLSVKIGFFIIILIAFFGFAKESQAAVAYKSSSGIDNSPTSINKPSGTVDGDLMIAVFVVDADSASSGSNPSVTPPAGWNQIDSYLSTYDLIGVRTRVIAFYKVAAGEGASYSFTINSEGVGTILSYSGADTTNPLNVFSGDVNGRYGSPVTDFSAPTITTTFPNSMLIHIAGAQLSSAITFSLEGWTERIDGGDLSNRTWMGVTEKTQAATGATGTITQIASQESYGASIMFAIKSIQPTPTPTNTPTPTPVPTNEFIDNFNDSFETLLQDHTPDSGNGWTKFIVRNGEGDEGLEIMNNQIENNSACGTNEGILYRTNEFIDSSNVESSITYVLVGDGDLDGGNLAVRIQDANNMYLASFTDDSSRIYKRVGGVWSTITGGSGPGISAGSIVKLIAEGSSLSLYDDGVRIIGPITDNSITTAGFAGFGMGQIADNDSSYDCNIQILDSFRAKKVLPWPRDVTVNPVTNNTNGYRVTLNGSANPNGFESNAHFRVYSSYPGSCSLDANGVRYPSQESEDMPIGSGTTSQNFSYSMNTDSGIFLEPNKNYWICAYAENLHGTAGSQILQFKTFDGQLHPCDPPTGGSYTIPTGAACTFDGVVNGLDFGVDESNTAVLTIDNDAQLTINPGQEISMGNIQAEAGSKLNIARGTTLKFDPIYVHDQDTDKYLDDKTAYAGSPEVGAEEFVRRNSVASVYSYQSRIASSEATLDCAPIDSTKWRIQPAYNDPDGDGYGGTQAQVGPNSPDDNSTNASVGTASWSNSGSSGLDASDNVYATSSINSTTISTYIYAADFDFSIPNGSIITGVKAEVERHASGTGVSDYSVRLYKGSGSYIEGLDKAATGDWPTTDTNTYVTYGGDGDTWGLPLTETNVENSGFRIFISAKATASRTARIDHVRLTIYYRDSAQESVCSGSTYPENYSGSSNDCSPANVNLYTLDSNLYKDGDLDGIVGTTKYTVCKGATNPSGWQTTSGTDCNDLSRGRTTNRTCYQDYDNDMYTLGGSSVCVGSSCTAAIDGQASGYLSSATTQVDCYDNNTVARPTEGPNPYNSGHQTDDRGDGSFDWDCSGNISYYNSGFGYVSYYLQGCPSLFYCGFLSASDCGTSIYSAGSCNCSNGSQSTLYCK